MTKRLSKTDWLKHGLRTLARSGFSGVKADPMAKSLGVSRGSFYWHFKDLADFHAELLDFWRAAATEAIIREIDQEHAERHRLEELMQRAFSQAGQSRLDQAIRQWAQSDEQVSRRLDDVDALRVDYIARLLAASGVAAPEARKRARFLYAASLGDPLISKDSAPLLERDDLRALAALLIR